MVIFIEPSIVISDFRALGRRWQGDSKALVPHLVL